MKPIEIDFNKSTAHNLHYSVLLLKNMLSWYIHTFNLLINYFFLEQMQKLGSRHEFDSLRPLLILLVSPDLEAQTKTRCI